MSKQDKYFIFPGRNCFAAQSESVWSIRIVRAYQFFLFWQLREAMRSTLQQQGIKAKRWRNSKLLNYKRQAMPCISCNSAHEGYCFQLSRVTLRKVNICYKQFATRRKAQQVFFYSIKPEWNLHLLYIYSLDTKILRWPTFLFYKILNRCALEVYWSCDWLLELFPVWQPRRCAGARCPILNRGSVQTWLKLWWQCCRQPLWMLLPDSHAYVGSTQSTASVGSGWEILQLKYNIIKSLMQEDAAVNKYVVYVCSVCVTSYTYKITLLILCFRLIMPTWWH